MSNKCVKLVGLRGGLQFLCRHQGSVDSIAGDEVSSGGDSILSTVCSGSALWYKLQVPQARALAQGQKHPLMCLQREL